MIAKSIQPLKAMRNIAKQAIMAGHNKSKEGMPLTGDVVAGHFLGLNDG